MGDEGWVVEEDVLTLDALNEKVKALMLDLSESQEELLKAKSKEETFTTDNDGLKVSKDTVGTKNGVTTWARSCWLSYIDFHRLMRAQAKIDALEKGQAQEKQARQAALGAAKTLSEQNNKLEVHS